MDSITHIALGVCIGEIALGFPKNKKILLWGAVAQSFPDVDSFSQLFLSPDAALLAHRGITHSVLFALVAGFLFATFLTRQPNLTKYPFRLWFLFFTGQMLVHDSLDLCNAYGTGIFEPFFHTRFSLHLLYVADPLFSLSLIVAALLLVFKRGAPSKRRKWAKIGIIVSSIYLCFSITNKLITTSKVEKSLAYNKIKAENYLLTPTPFNSLLWYLVAKQENIFYTGYFSIFDRSNLNTLNNFSKNDSLLQNLPKTDITHLLSFAQDFYTFKKIKNVLVFNVLRFGQIQGWNNPDAPFVFHYYLNNAGANTLAVQRSRFEGWNEATFKKMLYRIGGNIRTDSLAKQIKK
ncbi:MAG: metal-dependent hydrolase [Flavisolibacter sp.]